MTKQKTSRLDLTVIIPTYSGIGTIEQTLSSLANQKVSLNYEIVLVIDGPIEKLRVIGDAAKIKFARGGIRLKIIQFQHNKGRFEARIAGAKEAAASKLLFVDDRVQLGDNFFSELADINEKAVMPNVVELPTTNIISRTISMLRIRLYGRSKIGKFDDYYIDKNNFERSPKGTGALYVDKQIFLTACDEVKHALHGASSRFISDDTKLLYQVATKGSSILRTAKLNAYYLPRGSFKEAAGHLFHRGPLFVDYYRKPGTRFFPLLVATYLGVVIIFATIFINANYAYLCALIFFLIIIFVSAVIAANLSEFVLALVGLPATVSIFVLGVLVGTFRKMLGQ